MRYSLDLDERQYAMLCSDSLLLSVSTRHDVWSAQPMSGRWRLGAGDREGWRSRLMRFRPNFCA